MVGARSDISRARDHDTVRAMKRAAIYSGANRQQRAAARPAPPAAQAASAPPAPAAAAAGSPAAPPTRISRFRGLLRRHASVLVFAAGGLFAVLLVVLYGTTQKGPREYTQDDIDAAVLHTLENKTLPSRAAKAAEAVRQSVVRVRGFADNESGEEKENGIG